MFVTTSILAQTMLEGTHWSERKLKKKQTNQVSKIEKDGRQQQQRHPSSSHSLSPLTLTYMNSGCTQTARFEGRVQGVVVQAMRLTEGSSSRGKLTITRCRTTNKQKKTTMMCGGRGVQIKGGGQGL